MPVPKLSDDEILARVTRRLTPDENGCLIWPGPVDFGGYPVLSRRGTNMHVGRFVLLMATGSIPDNQRCLHSCSNKRCCNREHLHWGSQSENVKAQYTQNERRRITAQPKIRGSANGAARLDDDAVGRLRLRKREGATLAQLEQEFGVSEGSIRPALDGRTWSHVPGALTAEEVKALDTRKGSTPPNKKMYDELTSRIRQRRAEGVTFATLADEFGISVDTAWKACKQ